MFRRGPFFSSLEIFTGGGRVRVHFQRANFSGRPAQFRAPNDGKSFAGISEFTRLVHFYRHRSRYSPNCSRRSPLKTRIYFSRWSHNLVQEKRPYPSVMTGIPGYLDSFLGSPPFSEGAKCSVTYKGYREASNFSAFAISEVGITAKCRGNTVLSRSTKGFSRCLVLLFVSACLTVISRDIN